MEFSDVNELITFAKAVKEKRKAPFSYQCAYLGVKNPMQDVEDEIYNFLAGKDVEITGRMVDHNIIVDGVKVNDTHWFRPFILPKGSRSNLLNPGMYRLDKTGRLPQKANDKKITSFGDDGERTVGKNTFDN